MRWDGTAEDLPDGIDGAIARGFDEGGVDALCALVIMVPRDVQSRRVSGLAVDALRELARTHGFSSVMRITGTVAEWEEWVGMPFPDSSGEHWFPHASRPCRSTATRTQGATGSRTSGCTTASRGRRACG